MPSSCNTHTHLESWELWVSERVNEMNEMNDVNETHICMCVVHGLIILPLDANLLDATLTYAWINEWFQML